MYTLVKNPKKLKKIKYDGIEYLYKTYSIGGLYGFPLRTYTEFFAANKVKHKSKVHKSRHWLVFSKKTYIDQSYYDFKFQIDIDIEDPDYSKKFIRKKIKNAIKRMHRKQEIKNGNIL